MVVVKVDFKKTPWGGLGVQYLTDPHDVKKKNSMTGMVETISDVWSPRERDAKRFRNEEEAKRGLRELTHWSPGGAAFRKAEYVRLGAVAKGQPTPKRRKSAANRYHDVEFVD